MNAAQARALLAAAFVYDDGEREPVIDAMLVAFGVPSTYVRESLLTVARDWQASEDRAVERDDLAAELHLAFAGRLPCMEHVRRHPSDDPAEVAADVPTSDGHPTLCAPCRASAYPMRLP